MVGMIDERELENSSSSDIHSHDSLRGGMWIEAALHISRASLWSLILAAFRGCPYDWNMRASPVEEIVRSEGELGPSSTYLLLKKGVDSRACQHQLRLEAEDSRHEMFQRAGLAIALSIPCLGPVEQ